MYFDMLPYMKSDFTPHPCLLQPLTAHLDFTLGISMIFCALLTPLMIPGENCKPASDEPKLYCREDRERASSGPADIYLVLLRFNVLYVFIA
jgi:hypothetical protein